MPDTIQAPEAGTTPAPGQASLWRNPDFLKIWAAQTTAQLGSLLGVLPFVAILILDARPYQMAVLAGATTAARLAFGLGAGVWIDRKRRRIVLVIADFARAVSVASLAVAYFWFELEIGHLYVVAFINGSMGVFHDVAYPAYIPSLIGKERLLEANSKISASGAVVEQISFSIGGFIAQLASAITAGVVQAVTFVISGLLTLAIRKPEPPPRSTGSDSNIRSELIEGYRFIFGHPVLRLMAVSDALLAASGGIIGGMITLFALTEVGFQPGPLGVIYATGGISSFIGAIYATRVTRKIGVGRTLSFGLIIPGLIGFLIPLAPTEIWLAAIFFLIPQLLGDGIWILHDINEISLQQTVTPEHLRGRVGSAINVAETSAALIGVALAGVVAELAGLRWALGMGFVFTIAAGAVYLHPAIRQLKSLSQLSARGDAADH
ncbi:MAG: MFS transporter [Dehalococcoidia bacterium]|jgi:MFS family permease|nr:MFS transporter [Dehalococcoidia bacterium]